MKRFTVYTMRRTSTRTVYAIYDNAQRAPWSPPGVGRVFTTTDRSDAVQRARLLNAAVPL